MNTTIRFDAYGVSLRSLLPSDLEFLRAKRNSQDMRQWMTTDHEISASEMSDWYSNLPDNAYYLMVECQGKCVGHSNAKPLGENKYAPGYMFWDDDFRKQGGSVRAVMAFYNFMFDIVHATELNALTAIDNIRALRLAKGLGFVCTSLTTINGKRFEKLSLFPSDYALARLKYEELFQ